MRRIIQARLAFGDRDPLPLDEVIRYRKDELLLSFLDPIASIIPSTADECVIWEVTDKDRIIAYIKCYRKQGYKCRLVTNNDLVSMIPDRRILCRLLAFEWEDSYMLYSKLMDI